MRIKIEVLENRDQRGMNTVSKKGNTQGYMEMRKRSMRGQGQGQGKDKDKARTRTRQGQGKEVIEVTE